MPKCFACGADYDQGAKFCMQCGAAVGMAEAVRLRDTRRGRLRIVAGVLALAALGFTVLAVIDEQRDTQGEAECDRYEGEDDLNPLTDKLPGDVAEQRIERLLEMRRAGISNEEAARRMPSVDEDVAAYCAGGSGNRYAIPATAAGLVALGLFVCSWVARRDVRPVI